MSPKHVVSCSFGKDSIATILLALEHGEPLDEAVYCEVMFDDANDASADLKRREIHAVGELVGSGSGNAKDAGNVCHVHHQGQFFQRVILFLVHLASFLPFRESKFVFKWPRRIVRSEIYVLVKLQQES